MTGYLYESLFMQAAVLLHRLAMAQWLLDGNKRTAWVACATFLDVNGVTFSRRLSHRAVVEFVVSIVEQRLQPVEIARWLEVMAEV